MHETEKQRLSPIVGIGASAGGLSALETLFEQLPTDTGAAFVVVQHLSPDYQSHMTELLARRTSMPTVQLTEAETPKRDTVYLLPPGKHVVVNDGQLQLHDREDEGELNLPIDKFFRSLASECERAGSPQRRVAAMILSGTGSDGSEGIVEIHRVGGLVLSQDEDSAQFNSMPLNAIKTGCVHVVAPVAEVAESVVSYIGGTSIDDVVKQMAPEIRRNDLAAVFQRLEKACGVDFGQYKNGTFTRRLARRMMLSKIDQLDQYIDLLDSDDEELSRLADDLMIGVTRFFRDPDGYQRLSKRCIRTALASKTTEDAFRCWIAGCATGQEAYSIAMLVHEERANTGVDFNIKLFATDVHPDAIRFAQRGVYPEDSLTEIPKELRDKYLSKHPDGFEICSEVRNSIVFARHDVLQDAPFTNMDLITCRNMLIYLVDEAQSRVLGMFAHALRSRGVLWLGPSETPGDLLNDFATLDKQWRIFQKERETRLPLDLKLRQRPVTNATMSIRPRSTKAPSAALIASYDQMMKQYAPPSVLVDESMHPLQIFGDTSRFIAIAAGRITGVLEEILVEPLRMPIAVALQRMQLNGRSEDSESVIFEGQNLDIGFREFHHTTLSEKHFLITFGDLVSLNRFPSAITNGDLVIDAQAEASNSSAQDLVPSSAEETSDATTAHAFSMATERMRLMEMELDFTRENLQATIEEVETTNEELQSSNEELTSSNEELQSTNEELHSVNEELHTTNAESSRRMQLLTETTRDIENVMRESDIGIVLVDNDMEIRRVTPAAADILLIRRKDAEGESLISYRHALDSVDLVELVTEAHKTNSVLERETSDRRGDPILLRISPYRDRSGVTLTMTNLRSVKDTADKLRKLTSIVQDSTDAIIGVSLDCRITSWNRGATRLFGIDLEVDRNVELADVLPEAAYKVCENLVRELARKGEVAAKELPLEIRNRQLTLLIRATPVLDEFERVAAGAITLYDVTAIRNAEEQLRLRTRAIDAAKSGFLIVDAMQKDMPIVYANKGFLELTGFDPKDITGRNCRFLQGPKTDPDDIVKIRQALAKKESCRVTILNYRRDGSTFYNDLIVTPVTDGNDCVTHFVGIQTDVTEIVEANQALHRSELEYRSTFENAAVGMAHIGLEGRWLRANEKLLNILGYQWEELQEKTFQELTHPDDLDNDELQFTQMKRGQIEGYSMEKRYLHREGHIVWANLTTSLRRNADGSPDCCISLVEDITKRKQTEQKLSASRAIITEVIQQSEDPFISLDDKGVIQVANASSQRLSADVSEAIGTDYRSFFGDSQQMPLISTLDRVLESGRAETTEYYSQKLGRWYDVRVFPVDGGAAIYMTDVTGRKETEAYLEAARIAAEDASRAKSNFLTNMSHEIRSPMSAILGFADLTLRDIREGKEVDPGNLETVIRNGKFLLRIINDILDLSKVEAGKLEVRRTRFELLSMLSDISELMRHRSKASDVWLNFEFDGSIVQRLQSDRSRVEQILVNLIGNALKFTPTGSVRVVVGLNREGKNRIEFRVIDTGIGISPSNLDRLFQTFTQVHDRKMVGVEGTGLGLVISKRLSKLLGGDITVRSVEGEGSEFTLWLPIKPSDKLVKASASDLRPKDTGIEKLEMIDARILVADDARDVRLVTTRFLTRAGAEVVEATNGAEAVKAVREAGSQGRQFACVLMDMQMPELDGREATRQLRGEAYTMPIIALTAGATTEEINGALSVGCTEFVAKPVDANDLVRRVAKLLK
ncbi:PAS domain S-box protein [Planctomycetes bacterium K23_9]|uniref:Autoinducer 2 sensor kinase/phosphatase LuxQ n=1 Tax=Stieleria marina TaxID=1930275 RepID=A0A517NXV2_9BACT|nr:Autoinducer 2 sensor kinase/phosphatase LuxQ [Planctomycetes bacterium K23_9]